LGVVCYTPKAEVPYSWTQVANIKRDPFETTIGDQQRTLFGYAGELEASAKRVFA
jgi:arylsulfatase